MDIGLYSIFLFTTVMLILVPGPTAITIATQGANQGPNKAFFGVLGVASANISFFALSAVGIASLILTSSVLFLVIKWFGVIYLLYLGFTALFSEAGAIKLNIRSSNSSGRKLFSQGLIVQFANPKALMYFSALVPQFIDPEQAILFQLLIMGSSCLLADLIVYSLFGHLGDRLAKQKMKSWVIKLINRVAGITLISTGIKMASLEYRT